MKRMMQVAAAAAILGTMAACSAQQVSQTANAVQQACVTVAPVLSAGASSSNRTAADIAAYGNAVCGPVMAGTVPATVNSGTPTWLGAVAGMIQALLPLAVGLL